MPKIQVARTPQRIFPFTFFASRIEVKSIPNIAITTGVPVDANVPAVNAPLNENKDIFVAGFATMIFAVPIPMNAMKSPIPAETACFKLNGMALNIASRIFVRESTMKIRPSTNTAARAISQE